jgi:hypothetical protein
MSWSPPHPKDLTEDFVGQKESPHTHKPGKAGVLEHKWLCLTKSLIPGKKKSMQTQVPTQSWELWSEQEVSKIWISSWLWIISWFLSKSGGLYQGALVKEIRSCCQRLDMWYEVDETIPPCTYLGRLATYDHNQKKKLKYVCTHYCMYEWVSGFCSSSSNSPLFWFQILKTCQERGEYREEKQHNHPFPRSITNSQWIFVLIPVLPHGSHGEVKEDDCSKPGFSTWHSRWG